MGSMDESDTAYLSQRIAELESKQQLHADLYDIQRKSGKRCSAFCGIFQMLWLLACSVLIAIILSIMIPDLRRETNGRFEIVSGMVPVGTIRAWIPEGDPPEGNHPLTLYLKTIYFLNKVGLCAMDQK